jgi:hypothetical protein
LSATITSAASRRSIPLKGLPFVAGIWSSCRYS